MNILKTARDAGTTAEILETEDGQTLGYLWAPFVEDAESGFCFVEIQDIYVEEACRRQGVASALYRYVEEKARQHGAKVLRAGTGCENTASIQLHQSLGFSPYRYEFEKLL